LPWVYNVEGLMTDTLHPHPEKPFVSPQYIGGPFDGGIGAVEPASQTVGTIRLHSGHYSLQGFRLSSESVADILLAQVTPDRAVYLWEVGK
jgi:hypothetical protein